MAPKFGTSGLRGLVVELTSDLVADHVRAFLATCEYGGRIYIGEDLRPSSSEIAAVVAQAAQAEGCDVVCVGAVPTPCLALAAAQAACGAVMVTGSHIPADRNGLKFYTTAGEILKADEANILSALGRSPGQGQPGTLSNDGTSGARFVARYTQAFGPEALRGLRVGVYTHSAVGRDLLTQTISGLGADTVELGRSDVFIPVDTEAVDPASQEAFAAWASEHALDAIVSTDGDSDRPMLTDAAGRVIPGDILGQITARGVRATHVVTPVSSNSSVTRCGDFEVVQTRIGSPYVIAGMEAATTGHVVGYEANGGFLLGFEAQMQGGALGPLTTRDSFLPIVVPLMLACKAEATLADLAAREALVHTAANRLVETPQEASGALVARLTDDPAARASFLAACGCAAEASLDLTDGVRMSSQDGQVVHIRPSGNAPELRVYVEAPEQQVAQATLKRALLVVHDWMEAA